MLRKIQDLNGITIYDEHMNWLTHSNSNKMRRHIFFYNVIIDHVVLGNFYIFLHTHRHVEIERPM